MLDYLGAAARHAREQAALRQIDIATSAGVAHTTISNFELGVGWPERLDSIIAAYAAETGCDPVDLWATAVDRWRADR